MTGDGGPDGWRRQGSRPEWKRSREPLGGPLGECHSVDHYSPSEIVDSRRSPQLKDRAVELAKARLIGARPPLVPGGVDLVNDSIVMKGIGSRVSEHRVVEIGGLVCGRRRGGRRLSV